MPPPKPIAFGQPRVSIPTVHQCETAAVGAAPEVDQSTWLYKQLTLRCQCGQTHAIEVKAKGNLAVHKSVSGMHIGELAEARKDKWSLTAIPCGYSILYTDSKLDAMRCGDVLAELNDSFTSQFKEDVLTELPPWVRPWALACTAASMYLDPTSFKEQADDSVGRAPSEVE